MLNTLVTVSGNGECNAVYWKFSSKSRQLNLHFVSTPCSLDPQIDP